MDSASSRLEAFLLKEIPLSLAMGIHVSEAGPTGVALSAPLHENGNHHGTLFGGSASAIAILAAWGWVHLRLEDLGLDPDLVIQKSATDFVRPGRGPEVMAACRGTDEATFARFVTTLRRFKRARLRLEVEVSSGDDLVAHMHGLFVALERRTDGGPRDHF